jgi:signal peptidase I
METPVASRRRPWLAALLSFVWPGLGHLYAGRGRLALLLFLLFVPAELAILTLTALVPAPVANIAIPALLVLALLALVAHGAARAARGNGAAWPFPVLSRWYSCMAAVALIAGLNLLWVRAYRTTFIEAYKLPTGSMEPTILRGDRLLAVKWAYGWREPVFGRVIVGARQPKRGELTVFRYPEDRSRAFVKRCVGLPGETVEIRHKKVFVNGKPLDEPYAQFLVQPPRPGDPEYGVWNDWDNWGPRIVPTDSYFVLGDNRDNSRDSRFWGFVKQDDLLGRAMVLYWSWDATSGSVRLERIGRRLE